MIQDDTIQPLVGERLVHYAERLGSLYAQSMESQVKKDRDQFFTPREIANYMGQKRPYSQSSNIVSIIPTMLKTCAFI